MKRTQACMVAKNTVEATMNTQPRKAEPVTAFSAGAVTVNNQARPRDPLVRPAPILITWRDRR